jgi:MFS family permease
MMNKLQARLAAMPQLAALRHRGFRLLWIDTLFATTGRWADVVVVGWLTLELTNSATWVGIVAASKMAGYFVAPFMGVLADRLDRRRLLVGAAVVNCAVALTMFGLYVSGLIVLWHVIVLAMVSSLTWSLDSPTRQSYVPDLVDGKDLTNAIAINAVAAEITVVVGPALGGLLIPAFGMGGAYAMMAFIYLVDLLLLSRLPPGRTPLRKHQSSPLDSLLQGFRYVWGNQTVFMLLLIALLLNLFAAPYRYTFLPVFSRYVLETGPAGFGMLSAMAGIGALVAGVWLVSQGNYRHRGALLLAACFLWPAGLILFALSTSYTLSLGLIFLAGLFQAFCWTLIASLILSHTEAGMRGRVMGLRTGVVLALPVGNFFAGGMADSLGPPLALIAYALGSILVMLVLMLRVPSLRRLE